ncbi:stage III sporulation protein AB [Lachnospiraceae bacterium 66-29]
MLKLAGSILVITVSVLYGWQVRRELQEHVEQLVAMKEMFLMLWGEISYTRTPLKEAFLQIASQGKEPFSSFLLKAAEELEENESSMGCFWNRLVEQESNKFLFNEEERGLLQRAGENFGYLDGQMQLKNLELYMEQAEVLIRKAQKELKDKQKVSSVLSLMCGLFLVILLL